MCYVKDAQTVDALTVGLTAGMVDEYKEEDSIGKYRLLGLRLRGGAWRREDRPLLFFPIYIDPATGSVSLSRTERYTYEVLPIKPSTGEEGTWRWGQTKITNNPERLLAKKVSRDGGGVWDVFQKDYLDDGTGIQKGTKAKTIWDEKELNYQNGTNEVKGLFGDKAVFDFPKPVALAARILELGVDEHGLVVDFFAGSGTTGHGVLAQKCPRRRHPPFLCSFNSPSLSTLTTAAKRAAADFCDRLDKPRNIAELTKERLRRATKKVREDNPLFAGDLGFRVFKLDSSNIQTWDPDRADLAASLEAHAKNLKEDRTEQDILFELLLKLGLDLTVPIVQRTIAGKAIYSIGGRRSPRLPRRLHHARPRPSPWPLEWSHGTKNRRRRATAPWSSGDSAFADDVAKTNLAAIVYQHGLETVRSL